MRIEDEVATLKDRVERLEAAVNMLTGKAAEAGPIVPPFNQARLREWLMSRGVITGATVLEQDAARRWNELPEEEKQRIRAELDTPTTGPMVSDIVIEQRR